MVDKATLAACILDMMEWCAMNGDGAEVVVDKDGMTIKTREGTRTYDRYELSSLVTPDTRMGELLEDLDGTPPPPKQNSG